jgi:hypothetical protein
MSISSSPRDRRGADTDFQQGYLPWFKGDARVQARAFPGATMRPPRSFFDNDGGERLAHDAACALREPGEWHLTQVDPYFPR